MTPYQTRSSMQMKKNPPPPPHHLKPTTLPLYRIRGLETSKLTFASSYGQDYRHKYRCFFIGTIGLQCQRHPRQQQYDKSIAPGGEEEGASTFTLHKLLLWCGRCDDMWRKGV
uniref:Uncharacterized protein n=1 Tax=Arundo donax TaxID=35708 RepID=A0A0A9H705_ARUDO